MFLLEKLGGLRLVRSPFPRSPWLSAQLGLRGTQAPYPSYGLEASSLTAGCEPPSTRLPRCVSLVRSLRIPSVGFPVSPAVLTCGQGRSVVLRASNQKACRGAGGQVGRRLGAFTSISRCPR